MQLNIKFLKFRLLIFALVRPQNFCHIQADRLFVKILKSYSGDPKHINPFKTGSQKFSQFQFFLLMEKKEKSKNKEFT